MGHHETFFAQKNAFLNCVIRIKYTFIITEGGLAEWLRRLIANHVDLSSQVRILQPPFLI